MVGSVSDRSAVRRHARQGGGPPVHPGGAQCLPRRCWRSAWGGARLTWPGLGGKVGKIFPRLAGCARGLAPLLHRGDPHDRAEQRAHCRFLHTSRDRRAHADWLARAGLGRAPVSGR